MKHRLFQMVGRAASATVIVLILSVWAIVPATAGEKVIIFHAGSLMLPLAEIEKRFESANPGIDVQREAGGETYLSKH